jgi:beta-glucosidase
MLSRRLFTLSLLGLSFICSPARAEAPKQTQDKPSSCIPAEKDPKRHEGFLKDKEALLKTGPIQLVFIGDSITDRWRKPAGKAVWAKNYVKYNALNLGIGGDRTEHILWRVEHGELDGISPKALVIMIGTNNYTLPARQIAAGIRADVALIHEKLPNTKILLLAIFPRSAEPTNPVRAKLKAANEDISKLDGMDNVTFLDIGSKFLDPDGTLPKSIMVDGLHPSEKGFEIWADAINPTLERLMK